MNIGPLDTDLEIQQNKDLQKLTEKTQAALSALIPLNLTMPEVQTIVATICCKYQNEAYFIITNTKPQ